MLCFCCCCFLLLFLLLLQVRFSGDQGSITAMMSAEGEVVDLAAPVKVRHHASVAGLLAM
jgi:hypothetical protein